MDMCSKPILNTTRIDLIDRRSENQQIYQPKYPDFVTDIQIDKETEIHADIVTYRQTDLKNS